MPSNYQPKKLNLRTFTYRPAQPDNRAGDIMRRVRLNKELFEARQIDGHITYGKIEVTQVEGGYGWAISDLIDFPYRYYDRPIFTWGLEGTYSGNADHATPFADTGENNYGSALPSVLQDFIDGDDFDTWQPAIFVPRVIHWVMDTFSYIGCYILVSQLNPNSTETDKLLRIHYRFEGMGVART